MNLEMQHQATGEPHKRGPNSDHHPQIAVIIVNGRERTIPSNSISFEELVKIAYPHGHTKPDTRYTITYRNADQMPPTGELDEGGTVKVKTKGNGETIFNVTETVKS